MIKLPGKWSGQPEILQSEDIASFLKFALGFVLGLSLLGLVGVLQVKESGWDAVLSTNLLLTVTSTFAIWLLGRRKILPAVYIAVIGNGIALAYAAWMGAGVKGITYAALILPILTAALFLGARAGFLAAFAATIYGFALLVAGRAGWLVNFERPIADTFAWLANTTFFFVAAQLISISLWQVERALQKSHAEIDERKHAETEIRHLNAELEQRIAERTAQLAASEERYRLISTVSSDYMFSTQVRDDGTLELDWVAGAFEKITGYTREEYVEKGGWLAALHPEDLPIDRRDFARLLANEPVISEVRTLTKSGELRWVRVYAHPVWDAKKGQMSGIRGAVQDITERKQTEEALRASEKRFRDLVEHLPVITYTDNARQFGHTFYISPQVEALLGYLPLEWVDGDMDFWLNIIHPEDRESVLAEYKRCYYDNIPMDSEYRIFARNGKMFWFHDRAIRLEDADGQPEYIQGVMTDITDRKVAEQQLEEQTDQLAVLYQLGQKIVASVDLEEIYRSTQRAVEQLMPTEAFFISLVDEEHSCVDYAYLIDLGQRYPNECIPISKQSITTYVIQTGVPLAIADDADGDSLAMGKSLYGTDKDTRSVLITPLKLGGKVIGAISAQHYQPNTYTDDHLRLLVTLANQVASAIENARLVQSLRLQAIALDAAANAIVISDVEGMIQWVNPAFTELTGYSAAEAIGNSTNLLRSGMQEAAFYENLWKTLGKGQVWHGEIINRRKDGSLYTEEQIVTPVRDDQGKVFRFIAIKQDITRRKEAEDALRQSEIRFRSLFEQTHDAVFIMNLEGRHLHTNQRAADLLGYSVEELLHISARDTSAEWAESQKIIKRLLSGEIIPLYERRFRRKDGEIIPVEINVELVRDNYGQPLHIQSVVRDISIRKQAEGREKRQREMMEKVIELGKSVTKITDLRQCLRDIHQAVQKGLGFDRVGLFINDEKERQIRGAFGTSVTGEIEDTSWFVQSVDEYQEWQDALRQPGGMSLIDNHEKLHGPTADNEMYGVKQHVTLAAWAGEKPVALIAADNLITQREFSAEQLEALQLFAGYAGLAIENAHWNAELGQRVAERTTELKAANRELESLAYTIAHDLRIPARAMHGFASILKETQAEKLDAEAMRRLERIRDSASQMGRLVDDLLEFMRLGRVSLNIQAVDMNGMVGAARAALEKETAGREIQIRAHDLPACQGDRQLLKHVWINLLGNAIKFTRPRPLAQIEIGARQVEGVTQYFIRDNGVGFNMEFSGKLFGAFQRLHHPDEFEGTGMGLAIVQRIIQRHKGSIWAEAEVDKGATFYFTIG